MSARITWQPSTDADIASYDLERASSIGGPWSLLSNVPHNLSGPNWDTENTVFFYVDALGTENTYYRLTAIDAVGQRSPVSAPFQAAGAAPIAIPSLVNTIHVVASDVATLLDLGFTTIEIWSSEDEGGTWRELTSATPSPATLASAQAQTLFQVGGQTLVFQVDNATTYTVNFDPVIPFWTPAQVVSAINLVCPNAASFSGSRVVLTSPTSGRESSLLVIVGPAALNFSRSIVYGVDGRILLVDGATFYTYYDVAGRPTTRYKWRFSSNGANPLSRFSLPVNGKSTVLSGIPIAIATARFADVDGSPLRTAILVAPEGAQKIAGYTMGTQATKTFVADEDGLLQIPMVQGSRVRVAVEGTLMVRTFTVPSTPTFDLMQVLSDAPDAFTVQTVAPMLTRRNV